MQRFHLRSIPFSSVVVMTVVTCPPFKYANLYIDIVIMIIFCFYLHTRTQTKSSKGPKTLVLCRNTKAYRWKDLE